MTHETAMTRAKEITTKVLVPAATQSDKEGRFASEAVAALGEHGLLGMLVPKSIGGAGLGPRAFAEVTATLAEGDPSVAMVFLMHCVGAATIVAAPATAPIRRTLEEIAAGHHLTTLAFSEAGSRSHFWAPVSRARRNGRGVLINATKSWVTSAAHAQTYVVSTQRPEATQPTDSTLYLLPAGTPGLSVSGPWDGMGLRANASAPMMLKDCGIPPELQLTEEGGGLKAMMEVVLPLFSLGSAAVALGIARAVVAATRQHLAGARFDHLGVSLGEALPNLRAQLGTMQIDTDGLAARIHDTIGHLEHPDDLTVLRVLEVKAAAGEAAIGITSLAMRTCGGAAFSKHSSIERFFRDAHAGAVMAPTVDVLREMIGRSLLGMPLM